MSDLDTRPLENYLPDELEAYHRGRKAFADGILKQKNPEFMKRRFIAWSRGWREARDDKPVELPAPRRRMRFGERNDG